MRSKCKVAEVSCFPSRKDYLDLRAVIIIIILTLIWGSAHPLIKYTNQGVSPVFASTLRTVIASICGVLYCLRKGERLIHNDIRLLHGIIAGLLFGLQFTCTYFGLLYTDASRSVILVNISPFIVAIGAHFYLRADRLTFSKTLGLTLAFAGILYVFHGRPKTANANMVLGDILEIMAAFFWGATTLYIKRFMAEKMSPINTLLYQLLFSIPILLLASLVLEPHWIYKVDGYIFASILCLALINSFISLLVWFRLIHAYPVSRLSAFTFFTPIFGVFFGSFFLKEEFTISLAVGLPMVCIGIFLVNWSGRRRMII